MPKRRREFLRRLAVWLSRKGRQFIEQSDFVELIENDFKQRLARWAADDRQAEIERLFADLRSSGTLTRAGVEGTAGWRFSHNSLREYLAAELLLNELRSGRFLADGAYVTDAMRVFVASQPEDDIERNLTALTEFWPKRGSNQAAGETLSLLWNAGLKVSEASAENGDRVSFFLRRIGSGRIDLSKSTIRWLIFSTESNPIALQDSDFSDAALIDISFFYATLDRSSFENSFLDNVMFCNADLRHSRFSAATLMDVDLSGADLNEADFSAVQEGNISVVVDGQTFDGQVALGYLRAHGAITDDIPEYFVVYHHPAFDIAEKICRKMTEQKKRQRRGLEQRGAANRNPEIARSFVKHLISQGLIEVDTHGLVISTDTGRNTFRRFCDEQILDSELASFFLG